MSDETAAGRRTHAVRSGEAGDRNLERPGEVGDEMSRLCEPVRGSTCQRKKKKRRKGRIRKDVLLLVSGGSWRSKNPRYQGNCTEQRGLYS